MAHTPELEKLERRYDEDPAKWFAQLAEAYRKYQRVDDALAILNNHLADRPNYVSALIVLGRCYLDQQNDGEARAAFERVIAIDPENIIALKVMGDIAERGGDTDGARTWLARLLEVDPSNDDAREALDRLGAGVAGPEPEPIPAAQGMSFSDVADGLESDPLVIERASPESAPATVEMPAFELEPPVVAPVLEPAPEPELESTVQADLDVPVEPVYEGLPEAVLEPVPETVPDVAEAPVEIGELQFDNFDDPGVAPAEGFESTLVPETEDRGSLAGLPVILPPDEEPEAQPVAEPASGSMEDLMAVDESEPVVTETMAELYVQQGLVDEARATYRQLLGDRPGDARLSARLAALDPAPAPAAANRFSAADTGGPSVRTFLHAVLESRYAPPSPHAPAADAPTMDEAFTDEPGAPAGSPTRPASAAYSLGAVFGEESPAPAAPPPSPGMEGMEQGKGGQQGGGFSFDDFFGGGAKPATPPPAGDGGEGGDDDNFKSWLKGLKT